MNLPSKISPNLGYKTTSPSQDKNPQTGTISGRPATDETGSKEGEYKLIHAIFIAVIQWLVSFLAQIGLVGKTSVKPKACTENIKISELLKGRIDDVVQQLFSNLNRPQEGFNEAFSLLLRESNEQLPHDQISLGVGVFKKVLEDSINSDTSIDEANEKVKACLGLVLNHLEGLYKNGSISSHDLEGALKDIMVDVNLKCLNENDKEMIYSSCVTSALRFLIKLESDPENKLRKDPFNANSLGRQLYIEAVDHGCDNRILADTRKEIAKIYMGRFVVENLELMKKNELENPLIVVLGVDFDATPVGQYGLPKHIRFETENEPLKTSSLNERASEADIKRSIVTVNDQLLDEMKGEGFPNLKAVQEKLKATLPDKFQQQDKIDDFLKFVTMNINQNYLLLNSFILPTLVGIDIAGGGDLRCEYRLSYDSNQKAITLVLHRSKPVVHDKASEMSSSSHDDFVKYSLHATAPNNDSSPSSCIIEEEMCIPVKYTSEIKLKFKIPEENEEPAAEVLSSFIEFEFSEVPPKTSSS